MRNALEAVVNPSSGFYEERARRRWGEKANGRWGEMEKRRMGEGEKG